MNALMELGEVDAAAADLAARGRLTNEMHQPAQLWVQLNLEAARHIFFGEFEAAEESVQHAFELRHARGPAALAAFELQRFMLRREQGGLADIGPELDRAAGAYPNRPVLRCAVADLFAELDQPDEAGRRLALLAAGGFGGLPVDGDWLLSAALLARASARVGDRGTAAGLYGRLLPYADRNVIGEGDLSLGAVSGYLGLLAGTLEQDEDAADHFAHALEFNARIGAKPWLAHAEDDYARLLLRRGRQGDRVRADELLASALTSYRRLGMKPHEARLVDVGVRRRSPA